MTEKNNEIKEKLDELEENPAEFIEFMKANPEIINYFQSTMIKQNSFSGPLPPPDILKGYKEVEDDFPNRIMNMAESQANHRRELEKKVLNSNIINERIGLVFGFIIFVLGLIISYLLIMNDKTLIGIVSFIGVLGSGAAIFVNQNKKEQESINEKDNELLENKPEIEEAGDS